MEGATDRKRVDSGTQEKLWTLGCQQQQESVSLRSKACSIKEQLLITSSLFWDLPRCWLIVLIRLSPFLPAEHKYCVLRDGGRGAQAACPRSHCPSTLPVRSELLPVRPLLHALCHCRQAENWVLKEKVTSTDNILFEILEKIRILK